MRTRFFYQKYTFNVLMTVFVFIASMEFYRTTLFSNAIPDKLPRGTEFLSYLFASFVILYYFCK